MKPFFSIIVPVYQAEKTLERCVQSVLTQEYRDYEVILVNDGSTDSSGAVCDAFVRADSRIIVLHQANSGVSTARNAAIRAAQGEYLLFLDSDDALMPNALAAYADATLNGTANVVIGGLSVLESEEQVRKIGFDTEITAGPEIWEKICREPAPFGYAGGKAIQRAVISENGIEFNANRKSQEDLDFFLSAYRFCDSFHIIPECLYAYYYAPSTRIPPVGDYLANQIKLLRTAKACTNVSSDAEKAVHVRILSMLYTALYFAAEDRDYAGALEKLQRVDGLKELIKEVPAKGEHGFIARNFAAGRVQVIKHYFTVRRKVRDLVHLPKKR